MFKRPKRYVYPNLLLGVFISCVLIPLTSLIDRYVQYIMQYMFGGTVD